jgi:predicted Zn-dependent peptidase
VQFHHTTLDNGLEVIAERNAHARSVAVGFFVATGSRDETGEVAGVSHFLEHMMFKGTARRTALDVNREFDELGARYNAFTSEENTVFWAAVLPEYLPPVVDLLGDILRPQLRGEDFDMEKNVILEEISMYDDQPGYSVHEKCMSAHFGDHPLGNSVLGSSESIAALRNEQMRKYFDARYHTGTVTLAAAGNLDWEELVALAKKHCGGWPAGRVDREAVEPKPTGRFQVLHKESVVQEHVMQMAAAPPAESDDRFAADLLATIVGDGTGSRLFWALVDPGLVESAEMGYHEFQGAGAFVTYMSCAPDVAQENLRRIVEIYHSATRDGVSEEELAQAKGKIAARIVLRSERPMGRLVPLGFNWTYRRSYRSVEQDLDSYDAVTRDAIDRILERYPLDHLSSVALGPLARLDAPRLADQGASPTD